MAQNLLQAKNSIEGHHFQRLLPPLLVTFCAKIIGPLTPQPIEMSFYFLSRFIFLAFVTHLFLFILNIIKKSIPKFTLLS